MSISNKWVPEQAEIYVGGLFYLKTGYGKKKEEKGELDRSISDSILVTSTRTKLD